MVVGVLRRKGVVDGRLGGGLPTHILASIGAPPEKERFIEELRAESCRMMGGRMRFRRSCATIFP